jgi:uncharacterized protein (UPF0332 family)
MIDEHRRKQARLNFAKYLEDGDIKNEKNELAKQKYIENAEISLKVAAELMESGLRPHIWVVVTSYYSMFYIANAVLLELGYKTEQECA